MTQPRGARSERSEQAGEASRRRRPAQRPAWPPAQAPLHQRKAHQQGQQAQQPPQQEAKHLRLCSDGAFCTGRIPSAAVGLEAQRTVAVPIRRSVMQLPAAFSLHVKSRSRSNLRPLRGRQPLPSWRHLLGSSSTSISCDGTVPLAEGERENHGPDHRDPGRAERCGSV